MIIWNTKDCIIRDEAEKCNDVFVRAYPKNIGSDIDGDKPQDTDTHLRCRNKGSFNWRMKYNFKLPLDPLEDEGADRFALEIWDWDLLSGDDKIGYTEFNLNTSNMLKKVYKRKKAYQLT